MARNKNPLLVKLDKDVSEIVFGKQYGRPTVSRVVGRGIASAFGTKVGTGVGIFHVLLLFGLAAGAVAASRRVAI